MTKLVLVRRDHTWPHFVRQLGIEIPVLMHEEVGDQSDYRTEGTVFFVEEAHLDQMVEHLASVNPGKDIEVYSLEWSGVCPAAPMVRRAVTVDGILPA